MPRDYSLSLLEYIAHLSTGDYSSLVDDLVSLGFVDSVDDKSKLVGGRGRLGTLRFCPIACQLAEPGNRHVGRVHACTPAGTNFRPCCCHCLLQVGPLEAILVQLTAGGGAKKVNIGVVMAEIEKITQLYDFKIPPPFALILRTFSVIEVSPAPTGPLHLVLGLLGRHIRGAASASQWGAQKTRRLGLPLARQAHCPPSCRASRCKLTQTTASSRNASPTSPAGC